jgi:hypothetical protein
MFESNAYAETGTVFWPDVCNRFTAAAEAWNIFGLERPNMDEYPIAENKVSAMWTQTCRQDGSAEISDSQMVIDKKRAWAALHMAAMIVRAHFFFFERVFSEMKQSYALAYENTNTPFSMMPFPPTGHGSSTTISSLQSDGSADKVLCAAGLGFKNMAGSIAFIKSAGDQTGATDTELSWDELAEYEKGTPWYEVERPKSTHPSNLLSAPKPTSKRCLYPSGAIVMSRTASEIIQVGTLFARYSGEFSSLLDHPALTSDEKRSEL